MKVTHNGKTQQFCLDDWLEAWANPDKRRWMTDLAREGEIATDEGVPIEGVSLQRLRNRLLGIYDDRPPLLRGRRTLPGERPWLIPGLWPWGTIPALGGNPKAGKTTIVTELVPALLNDEHRFLDYFDPACVPDEEWDRGVLVVNAETPPIDLEAALDLSMDEEDWGMVSVAHLEDEGGAHTMDLIDPVIYDEWAHRLADCFECDGTDDGTPFVVIVDGVTAILQAGGKSTEHFGLWYAAFRRLLRECDVPNGLAVGHNTLSGGHLMGGVAAQAGADGLWSYDRKNGVRKFSVKERVGGASVPPLRVNLNADGRPVASKVKAQATEPPPKAEPEPVANRVLAFIRERNSEGVGPSQRQVRDGVAADNRAVTKALGDLAAEGVIEARKRTGRGGGAAYWIA